MKAIVKFMLVAVMAVVAMPLSAQRVNTNRTTVANNIKLADNSVPVTFTHKGNALPDGVRLVVDYKVKKKSGNAAPESKSMTMTVGKGTRNKTITLAADEELAETPVGEVRYRTAMGTSWKSVGKGELVIKNNEIVVVTNGSALAGAAKKVYIESGINTASAASASSQAKEQTIRVQHKHSGSAMDKCLKLVVDYKVKANGVETDKQLSIEYPRVSADITLAPGEEIVDEATVTVRKRTSPVSNWKTDATGKIKFSDGPVLIITKGSTYLGGAAIKFVTEGGASKIY